MDTKKDSAISDVPTFKVARVGEDRKRKGGAFSFLRGGGARGSWSGATGGSGLAGAGAGGTGGLAGALGLNFTKLMMTIFLTASVGSGAVYLGARSAANARSTPDQKPALFADKGDIRLEGDTSNLPSTPNTIPNSLGYLSGSRDGLTPEERAKKAAEAAAAAEAQRLADEEAARKEEEERLAGNPAVDPNALLASAQADGANGGGKGGAFGKKFGALTSSFGGGSSLSGGAGLSGGVNRQFGSGGSIKKGASGKLSAMKGAARPSYAKAGKGRLSSSKTKGFARKQLANANAYSRRGAAAGTGETSASDAGTAFDNNPGAGNVISGPGIGQGAGSSSGADSTPNSVNNGGPTGGDPTVDCGADHYQDEYGNCKKIKTQSGKDANPTLTMLAKIAQGLFIAIAALAILAMIVEKTVYTYAMGPVFRGIIGVLGGIIALMGVAIMAMGDYMQGAIFAGIGGFIGIAAWAPGMETALTSGGALVSAGAGALLSQAAGSLKSYDKNSAPEAAQQ
jgi:hypothetical protein